MNDVKVNLFLRYSFLVLVSSFDVFRSAPALILRDRLKESSGIRRDPLNESWRISCSGTAMFS
jgi:hypothetical protein